MDDNLPTVLCGRLDDWEQSVKKLAVVLVVPFIFLVGCGGGQVTVNEPDEQRLEGERYSIPVDADDDPQVTVFEVDGVKCIAFQGYESSGLSCDWSGSEG